MDKLNEYINEALRKLAEDDREYALILRTIYEIDLLLKKAHWKVSIVDESVLGGGIGSTSVRDYYHKILTSEDEIKAIMSILNRVSALLSDLRQRIAALVIDDMVMSMKGAREND